MDRDGHEKTPSLLRPRGGALQLTAAQEVTSVGAVHPGASMEQTFDPIYRDNLWGDTESVSGPGSTLEQTAKLRKELPALLNEIAAKSLLDAACGDFNWLSKTQLPLSRYIGADIIPALINQNEKLYGDEQRRFLIRDITRAGLPTVDVILCRDCFIHFSFRHVAATVRNFKASKSTYLLTNTYTRWPENHDIHTGEFRPVNLQLPPFNFPPPLKLISEKFSEHEARYFGKSLGLWRLADL